MRLFSGRNRPVHLGPYPLERLKRATEAPPEPPRPARPEPDRTIRDGLDGTLHFYRGLFEQFRDGTVAPQRAPVPEDPVLLVNDLKAAAYFLNAAMVGACATPGETWYATGSDGKPLAPYHSNAFVILVAEGRAPEPDNLAHGWTRGTQAARGDMRAAQIAGIIAGYIRRLGWSSRAQIEGASDVWREALAARAGLGEWRDGQVVNPFLGTAFRIAVVTTDMPLAHDPPLDPGRSRLLDKGAAFWLGTNGAYPELERRREKRRLSHLGRHPMEHIKRVDKPTTLILEDEVPRVPKRAAWFERAFRGDIGDKAQRERTRFAMKHPFANAMGPIMRSMVPHQDGQIAPVKAAGTDDPDKNARAIKSLCYYLDADMVGICLAKPFVWYSHDDDGDPIEVKHKYAIALVLDQGYETMEGASGDDWISASQSMRGYMRGAEICGIVAAHIRSLGYSARSHTNIDSEVIHVPLLLLAGLGEISRIGELVLNPFVGPRFKSAIITTDMPLAVDKMIDFGLQDMCSRCMKCARECPCDALSWGDKVMFNGYETWKPDAERCTRYRVTNPKGSACGRCMKACPYNHEGLLYHKAFLWAAIHLPFTRRWIARLDDKVGNGRRNLVKKWWHDLELVDGVCVTPRAGSNQRELDLGKKMDPAKQKIAYYHANMMPPPDQKGPHPVDRKAALAAAALIETPTQALERRRSGGATPAHYIPTPPLVHHAKPAAPKATTASSSSHIWSEVKN